MWSDIDFFTDTLSNMGFQSVSVFKTIPHSSRKLWMGKNRFQSDPKSLLVCNQKPCDGELLTSLTVSSRNFITLVFSQLIFILFLLAKTWVCHQNAKYFG